MVKSALGNRIRSVREKANLSQEALAKRLGVTPTTINRYERGHRLPDAAFLGRLASIFSCDPSWLLTGEKKELEDFVFVPQVRGEISAGKGLPPREEVEILIAFRKEWITKKGDPKNMALIRVKGDSMEPTLFSSDLVLVDHSRDYLAPEGGLYAVAVGQEIMVKRLQAVFPGKKIRIISDNPRYEPMEADPERININGKVIWFGREIKE